MNSQTDLPAAGGVLSYDTRFQIAMVAMNVMSERDCANRSQVMCRVDHGRVLHVSFVTDHTPRPDEGKLALFVSIVKGICALRDEPIHSVQTHFSQMRDQRLYV
jgi:hypothetical protein